MILKYIESTAKYLERSYDNFRSALDNQPHSGGEYFDGEEVDELLGYS